MKKSRLLGAVFTAIISTASMSSYAAPVSGLGTWETTLQARDLDGNTATVDAYYDTVLDITWLSDAYYAGTRMNWSTANGWATTLDINGITGWRLPTIWASNSCINAVTCGFNVNTGSAATTVYSEYASMYYDTLGNLGLEDTSGQEQPGWGLANTGPFSNLLPEAYWTEEGNQYKHWYFHFKTGFQFNCCDGTYEEYAWAVHSGDVGAAIVPIPAALWLFGSGLLGIIGIAGKKTA